MRTRSKNFKICHCNGISISMTEKGRIDKQKAEENRLTPKIFESINNSAKQKAEAAIDWLFSHQKNYQIKI